MTGVVAVLASGSGFRVFATPDTATGSRSGSGPVTSNAVFVSVLPPTSYSVSWDVDGMATANSPFSASTTFTDVVIVGEPSESTATATVTVSGQVVGFVIVPVILSAN